MNESKMQPSMILSRRMFERPANREWKTIKICEGKMSGARTFEHAANANAKRIQLNHISIRLLPSFLRLDFVFGSVSFLAAVRSATSDRRANFKCQLIWPTVAAAVLHSIADRKQFSNLAYFISAQCAICAKRRRPSGHSISVHRPDAAVQ